MIEKYNPRGPITFESKIRELMDSKEEISKKRELLKKEFQEAIKQDKDSSELYSEYRAKSEEYKKQMDEYDFKINTLTSRRDETRNMQIYSKTSKYQDKQLEGDGVYEYLKKKNDKELIKKMKERKMSFDEYMTILYSEIKDKPETTEDLIKSFMERFSSGTAVLEVKVGQKGNGRGIKTIDDEGKFETEIGEEYILTRLSRYFMKTQKVTLDDLKKNIKFPEGVKISKPEDTEIKFEYGDIKGVIKVKFIISENGEQLSEKEASPKQLFLSLEQYIKNRVGDDLAKASRGDIEAALQLLEGEQNYKEFCEMCRGEEVLDKPEIKFPHSFKDFLDKIAPIELDKEKLIAVLQSNYKRKKGAGGVLVFDAKCFKNYREYPELEEKYQKRNDYIKHYPELNELQKEKFENLKMEIHKIEGKIIDTYYPHLREVYFKDQVSY